MGRTKIKVINIVSNVGVISLTTALILYAYGEG